MIDNLCKEIPFVPSASELYRYESSYHLSPGGAPITPYDYEVKSWPAFFAPMIAGVKKHDMRNKRDRAYSVGDTVLLREFDPFGSGYTGRSAVFRITYITSNDTPCALSSAGLDNDMAILSMELVEVCE
jgi:hypothetical protein